jgi:hypothetical protein
MFCKLLASPLSLLYAPPLSPQGAFFVAKQINSHQCFAELHAWALQSQQRVLADLVAKLIDNSNCKGDQQLMSS